MKRCVGVEMDLRRADLASKLDEAFGTFCEEHSSARAETCVVGGDILSGEYLHYVAEASRNT